MTSQSPLSISFKDQLCFEAHWDYILNASHVPPQVPYLPRRDPDARAKVNLDLSLLRTRLNSSCHRYNNAKGWRWVDFRPKYHTQAPRSPKMVFGGKKTTNEFEPSGASEYKSRGVDRLLMTPSGKFDDGRYAEALDYVLAHEIGGQSKGGRAAERGRKRPPFRTRFHCSAAWDDRIEKARERREYVVYPYRNPQPFDHRGVRMHIIIQSAQRGIVHGIEKRKGGSGNRRR